MSDPRFFCDTSFFFASLHRSDPNHGKAEEFLLSHPKASLVTTWDIVGETITLLRYRTNYLLATQFLSQIKPHLEIVSCDNSAREEAIRIFRKFSRDKRLSYCDCLSFVVLTGELSGVKALTFDPDFRRFGLSVAC